jgi:polyisoprenoid-binding protein YceI
MKTVLSVLSVCLLTLAAFGALAPRSASRETARAAEELYAVDNAHSAVLFKTKHLGISSAYGRFNACSGTIVWNESEPFKSSIELEVEAASVDTNEKKRDDHLRSPDFLSAKEFPTIAFKSSAVEKQGSALEVTGDLTLHGKTKEITLQAHAIGKGDSPFGDHRAGFEASFTIDMNDFAFQFVNQNPGAVGPEVTLTIALEAIRQDK